jgi:hypothetical protein
VRTKRPLATSDECDTPFPPEVIEQGLLVTCLLEPLGSGGEPLLCEHRPNGPHEFCTSRAAMFRLRTRSAAGLAVAKPRQRRVKKPLIFPTTIGLLEMVGARGIEPLTPTMSR